MKLGFFSDLHLEFREPHKSINTPQAEGDVLLVVGDFTVARLLNKHRNDAEARSHLKILNKIRDNWFSKYQQVLYIPGNHEHYNWVFKDTVPRLQEFFFDWDNVMVMDNDIFDTKDGIRIIGSTLWSDFEKGNPNCIEACQWGMNDFRIIYKEDPTLADYIARNDPRGCAITPYFAWEQHDTAKKYIELQAKAHSGKVIVFTHHAPTYESLSPEHSGNGLDGAYASDLSQLILDNPNISNWIHGHTHRSLEYKVGDCTIMANQCGYWSESWFKDFKGIRQIEV